MESSNQWFFDLEMENQYSSEILDLDSVNTSPIFNENFMGTINEFLGEDLNIFDPFSDFNASMEVPSVEQMPFSNQASSEPPLIHSEMTPKKKRMSEGSSSTAPIIMLNFGEAAASSSKKTDNETSVWPPLVNNDMQITNKSNRVRPKQQVYGHMLAERKRRKLIKEQFITLSGIVPGLEKMDKTSVLAATIKYIRNLKERVEMLEEKLAKETVESAVLVRKSQIMVDQELSDENSGCNSNYQPLPEIEAKVCNNQALIKIHCIKQKDVMARILNEVDKLNLTVLHSNVSPFGNLILDVTITVEMDKEYTLTANQIVEALHLALVMDS